jgi:Arc/MetJ-type ribon-helix-helix transcriptional regulator
MQTLNIAIPDTLNDYVLRQVEEQGYVDAGEFVHELIAAAQKEDARRKLEAELLLGLQSGSGEPITAHDWQTMREEVQNRHTNRQGKLP